MNRIIFFDGECGLCDRVVDFFIRADRSKKLLFSPLQSPFAIRFFKERRINVQLDTLFFYYNQQIYDRSAAVKQLFLYLSGYWRLIGVLIGFTPKTIADFIYKKVAKNRFKLLGRTTCRIPNKEERARFLED